MATAIAIGTMTVAQVSKPGADFQIVEGEIPEPSVGEVRIKVQACGVCHSDVFTKEGLWPGIQYPRVPGHEVVGFVDEVGAGVSQWKKGQRTGVGWHGGHDNTCRECRRGRFSQLPQFESSRHQLRRRIPAIHAGSRGSSGGNTGNPKGHRSSTAAVRRGLPHLTPCGTAARCPATLSRFRAW